MFDSVIQSFCQYFNTIITGGNLPVVMFLLQVVSTAMMTGLVWFVQLVHYPLFQTVSDLSSEEAFGQYAEKHTRQTTWVVAPLMLCEAGTGIYLLYEPPKVIPMEWILWLTGLLILNWVLTAFWSVPMHNQLVKGFHPKAHRWLMWSNTVRTLTWSVRTVLVTGMAYLWIASKG
jgi:hypothetical protein